MISTKLKKSGKKRAVETSAVDEIEDQPSITYGEPNPSTPSSIEEPSIFDDLDRVLARAGDERFKYNQGIIQMRALWERVHEEARAWQRRWDAK